MAWGLRGSAALADDAPPFALGAPAPHALLLAEGEGVLEARLADGTLGTDLFGRVGLVVGGRVEGHRIEAAARGVLAPGLLHGGGSVPLVLRSALVCDRRRIRELGSGVSVPGAGTQTAGERPARLRGDGR